MPNHHLFRNYKIVFISTLKIVAWSSYSSPDHLSDYLRDRLLELFFSLWYFFHLASSRCSKDLICPAANDAYIDKLSIIPINQMVRFVIRIFPREPPCSLDPSSLRNMHRSVDVLIKTIVDDWYNKDIEEEQRVAKNISEKPSKECHEAHQDKECPERQCDTCTMVIIFVEVTSSEFLMMFTMIFFHSEKFAQLPVHHRSMHEPFYEWIQ